MDPLIKASQGYSQSGGGYNIPELKKELIAIYPSRKDEINEMRREELEVLAYNYLNNKSFVPIEQTKSILDSPYEIIMEYLLPLDLKSLQEACRTSKKFAEICRDETFWSRKYRYDYGKTTLEPDKTWKEMWIDRAYPVLKEHFIIMKVPIVLTNDRENFNFNFSPQEIELITQDLNDYPCCGALVYITKKEVDAKNRCALFTFKTITDQIDKNQLIATAFSIFTKKEHEKYLRRVMRILKYSYDIPNITFNVKLPVKSFVVYVTKEFNDEGDFEKSPNFNRKRASEIANLIKKHLGQDIKIDIEINFDEGENMIYFYIGLKKYMDERVFYQKIKLINDIERTDPDSVLIIDGEFRPLK